ncbi:MAG: FAD-linked oxidase C-terminal domain-containing protein [Gammaproteobacteria bacterium]|nr:MAG: FAD-linked oxidase C-terminal domain-containing protein [Gammaproteobacteria bacterium]
MSSPDKSPLDTATIRSLYAIVGHDNVLTDDAECWPYGQDNSRRHAAPDAVVFSSHTEQIAEIIKLCRQSNTPLTVRGRGTNTTGATVPHRGGIVLSLERMDKIIEIDADNRLLRAQPGVINQAVQQCAGKHNLFWPPDPTSAAYCTIGGNLGMNAAGPYGVKYGSTRDHVLGLTAVTGAGEIIKTGVSTSKGVVGYDLTRLLIGSEGTLAVITEATLKLSAKPEARKTLRAFYGDIDSATAAIVAIMKQPGIPCALEFMDRGALNIIREHTTLALPKKAQSLLIIEVEGDSQSLPAAATAVQAAADNKGLLDLHTASSDEETTELWRLRKALSPALRDIAPNKLNEDVVVPVTHLPELLSGLETLSQRYSIPIINFGHAGNGNIHVNLLYDTQDPKQSNNAHHCLSDVFDLVLALGGTLSGEHGVGLVKKEYVSREIDAVTLNVMGRIKKSFDPDNILNPDKAFPTE